MTILTPDDEPLLAQIAARLESLDERLEGVDAKFDTNSVNIRALISTLDTYFKPEMERIKGVAEGASAKATDASTKADAVEHRTGQRFLVVVLFLVALAGSNGYTYHVGQSASDAAKQAKGAVVGVESNQRRGDLEVCYTIVVVDNDFKSVFGQILSNAKIANQKAQASPSATAQVKALAADQLQSTQEFVAQAETSLAAPDCSVLPKP